MMRAVDVHNDERAIDVHNDERGVDVHNDERGVDVHHRAVSPRFLPWPMMEYDLPLPVWPYAKMEQL